MFCSLGIKKNLFTISNIGISIDNSIKKKKKSPAKTFNPNLLNFIALKVQIKTKQGIFAKPNPDWQGFTNMKAPLGHL